ncbi:MAG TPA: response regulator transcription factor [Blastocatellia bacterium]|nr:response regulator transcription factor [Blastocatellia bacterium]
MTRTHPPAIRILLISAHTLPRTGLRLLIESHAGMIVTAEADHPASALEAARSQPDIILLDYNEAEAATPGELRALLAVAPEAGIILLGEVSDPGNRLSVIQAGVMGFVHRNEPVEVLHKAIEKVHAGEVWLNRLTVAQLLRKRSAAEPAEPRHPEAVRLQLLTAREREILALVCEGLRNKEIASRLFISEATTRNHLTSVFSKLGVADRFELVDYAYRHQLVPLPSASPGAPAGQEEKKAGRLRMTR